MAVELIAEISSNHGGSIALAKEFIHRFAEAGADWVKFQTTRVKHLRKDDPQYAWFQQAELADDAHFELKAECEQAGVKFLTTVFNAEEVPFLKTLGLEAIKIGSGESSNRQLAWASAHIAPRVIQSVHLVGNRCWYDVVKSWPGDLLSCVTRYPASPRACEEAIAHVGYYRVVGYSDHSVGLEMPKWAIESGARIIEKHVCLPNQARPCKPYEATVEEFKALRQFADDDPSRFIGRWQAA